MKFKNISGDERIVPAHGVTVAPGEHLVATAAEAAGLAGQVDVWEPADDDARKARDAALGAPKKAPVKKAAAKKAPAKKAAPTPAAPAEADKEVS